MNNVELNCTSGIVQLFQSLSQMLEQYGACYTVRNGNELWHKGNNVKVGTFELLAD